MFANSSNIKDTANKIRSSQDHARNIGCTDAELYKVQQIPSENDTVVEGDYHREWNLPCRCIIITDAKKINRKQKCSQKCNLMDSWVFPDEAYVFAILLFCCPINLMYFFFVNCVKWW